MANEQEIKQFIDNQFATSKFNLKGVVKDQGITNYINKIGKHFGIENITMDDNDLYNNLDSYVRLKLNEAKNSSMKKILTETDSIITNVNMLNYQDSDVIKIIKAKFNDEFADYTLEKIVNDGDGPFYNLEVTAKVNSEIKGDLEVKRFNLTQLMNNFKGQFLMSISEVLPVVNTKIASFQFTKNSDKIKFGVSVLLSNTNNRNWVTGEYQQIDEEAADDILKESKLNELRVKSNLIPTSLTDAINQFKSNQINRRMLETAIKACKRNELERYVMNTLNLKTDKPLEDDNKEEIEEAVEEQVKPTEEQVADNLFNKYKYDFDWQRESVKEMRELKFDKNFIVAVINILAGEQYFDDKEFF